MSFAYDKRYCVYPCYINANRSVSEGRKIPKDKACDNPMIVEVFDSIVNGLKLEAELERKWHPRDWATTGRVRVKLFDDDGKPVNPDIANKRTLLIKIAELVPRHPNRTGKGRAQASSSAGASSAKQSSSSSSKKSSGKKKR